MEKISLKSLTKDSAKYGISLYITHFFTAATFIILVRVLTKRELGYIAFFESIISFLSILPLSSIKSALNYHCNLHPGEKETQQYLSTGYKYLNYVALLFLVALILFQNSFFAFFNLPPEARIYFYFFLFIFFCMINFNFFNTIFKLLFERKKFIILNIFRTGFIFIGIGFLGIFKKITLTNYYIIFSLSITCCVLAGIFWTKNKINGIFSLQKFQDLFHYGSQTILASVALYFMNFIDRISIQKLLSTESLGIYAVGFNTAMFFRVIYGGFERAWAPSMFKAALQENNTDLIKKAFSPIAFTGLLFYYLLSCFSPEIVRIIATNKYAGAIQIVILLAMSHYFYNMVTIFHSAIHLSRKPIYYSIIILITGILNIGLNIYLIPIFGITGAALATLISWLIACICVFLTAQKLYYIAYNIKKLLITFIFALFSVYVTFSLNGYNLPYRIALFIFGITLTLVLYHQEFRQFISLSHYFLKILLKIKK